MGDTSIQWTDRTVNPIRARNKATGAIGHFCEKVSPGCSHCYASTWNERVRPITQKNGDGMLIGTGLTFDVRSRDQIEFFLDDAKLNEVLKRKQPTKWFWSDMTDMFGEWVPDEWIDRCFAVMALTPHHTHQVLTKRADRMRRYIAGLSQREASGMPLSPQTVLISEAFRLGVNPSAAFVVAGLSKWPLPNVWLGVSAEDQQRANERIPQLIRTPAAVRFVSCEPLLEKVLLDDGEFSWLSCTSKLTEDEYEAMTPEQRRHIDEVAGSCCMSFNDGRGHFHGVDWVIVGGESGLGARPMDLAWARSIVQQCKAAGVACFVKQLGADARGLCDWPHHDECPPRQIDQHGCDESVGHPPFSLQHAVDDAFWPCRLKTKDRKGGDPSEWPSDLNVRQFPEVRS